MKCLGLRCIVPVPHEGLGVWELVDIARHAEVPVPHEGLGDPPMTRGSAPFVRFPFPMRG